jgi:hypothetical protein
VRHPSDSADEDLDDATVMCGEATRISALAFVVSDPETLRRLWRSSMRDGEPEPPDLIVGWWMKDRGLVEAKSKGFGRGTDGARC